MIRAMNFNQPQSPAPSQPPVTSVKFNGLPLSKKAIDELDLAEIQRLKAGLHDQNYILNSVLYTGLGLLGFVGVMYSITKSTGMLEPLGIPKEKSDMGPYLGIMAMGIGLNTAVYLSNRRGKAKELDVIEYIKTGAMGRVWYKESTIYDAHQTGMKIGPV